MYDTVVVLLKLKSWYSCELLVMSLHKLLNKVILFWLSHENVCTFANTFTGAVANFLNCILPCIMYKSMAQ